MRKNEYSERQSLIDELHARPFHDFDNQGRFIRYIYLVGAEEPLILNHISQRLADNGRSAISGSEKLRREDFKNFNFRLERHSEFVSVGLIVSDGPVKRGLSPRAFSEARNKGLPFAMIEAMPAVLFHAVWLEIGGAAPPRLSPQVVTRLLESRTAASNRISDASGQIHFSFDLDEDGYSRAIFFAGTLSAVRKGRLVLRLLEMESYRMLSLLALPLVRHNMGRLHEIDTELAQLTQRLTAQINGDQATAQALLPELSALSAEIEAMSANTSFRLSATKAYKEIFLSRLEELRPSRLDGHQGLYGFLDRRMMPALQTCLAFEERLQGLSARIARAGSLLRAQTETMIQEQNRNLLASMDRRAQAQLRLQQTVEGLSVIAGTYYGVGLVGYMMKLLPQPHAQIDSNLVKAFCVPVIAFLIWWFLHRTGRSVKSLTDQK